MKECDAWGLFKNELNYKDSIYLYLHALLQLPQTALAIPLVEKKQTINTDYV